MGMPQYLSVGFVLGLATAAQADVFECEIRSHSRIGWIPDLLFVELNDQRTRAKVIDNFVYHVIGKPLAAKVTIRNASSVALDWVVEDIPVSDSAATATVSFKATLNTSTGRLSYRALPRGTDHNPTGTGTCVLKKGRL